MMVMQGVGTIGIVGGGQLARMLTLAALPLGFKVVVVDSGDNCPATQVGATQIKGDLYDPEALRRLADQANYLTVEIEHLDAETLAVIANLGKPVNPAAETIALIQDKLKQKVFLQAQGIPIAPFSEVNSREQAGELLSEFGGVMLLKARHGAYDGRGNMVIKNKEDLEKVFQQLGDTQIYAEAFVPYVKELAIMIARDMQGNVKLYPVTETIHTRSICVQTITPAQITESERSGAEKLALNVSGHLKGAGVFGIEMFLTKSGETLVNEIAPRVHNSGHYTIEACRTSQFEQHIRAISNLPLGTTDMVVPAAVMINILGERDGKTELKGLAESLTLPDVSVHLYGKSPTRVDRKMGHLTATAETIKGAQSNATKARERITI